MCDGYSKTYDPILAAIFFNACSASIAASTLPTLLQYSAANNKWSIELVSGALEETSALEETDAAETLPDFGGRPRFFGSLDKFLSAWLTSATDTSYP